MNIYEMLKEHLPKEKDAFKPAYKSRELNEHWSARRIGYNQGINAVFDILKRAKIDEEKVLEIINKHSLLEIHDGEIGMIETHVPRKKLAKNISKTNILRIEDEK